MKPEHQFTRAGGLSITWQPRDRCFTCWRPHRSVFCRTPKEVLAFARWPASTPTGQALREWLQSIDLREPEPETEPSPALVAELQATGFDPKHHDLTDHDPIGNTRTII